MAFFVLVIFVMVLARTCECVLYRLDSTWAPELPAGAHTYSGVGVAPRLGEIFITQRGNRTIDPVLVLDGPTGKLLRTWGRDYVGLDESKSVINATWGSHGIGVQVLDDEALRVWICDFTNFTFTAFDKHGNKLLQLGTNGHPGNGTVPTLQFGNVADTTFGPGGQVFATDGDGGTDNRVVGLRTPPDLSNGLEAKFVWATSPVNRATRYNNPHSIAYHAPSKLLIVCDRDNNATRLLRASDGKDMGVLDCGLDFGPKGKPFGVRTMQVHGRDMVFIAIMDNPQDGRNQKIAVLDGSQLATGKTTCSILQIIDIPTSVSGPHLLGVDTKSADLYTALVNDSPKSTVLRFKWVGDEHADVDIPLL